MLELLLICVLHIILILAIVILIQFSDNFNYCIRALLICCTLQALTIIFQIGTPVGLLYGPLLYLAGQAARGKSFKRINSIHFIPFFLLTIVYSILSFGISIAADWSTKLLSGYYPAYFITMTLSLAAYPLILIFQKKGRRHIDPWEEALLIQLSSLEIILAIFMAAITGGMFFRLTYAYPPEFLTYAILIMGAVIVSRHLYHSWKKKHTTSAVLNSSERPENKNLAGYAEKIHHYLAETKIYLHPNLSLDMLSHEIGIPKTIFSEVLNAYMGKNFYQLTAEYRIKHALELLKEKKQNYTLEALAYECGFNSKTSFNRYFKQHTGYKPSEYRLNHSA